MLSYRHSYHAGNHADVLKHSILVQLLAYLGQKDKAFQIIDTHAGAGLYALDSVHAEKLGEFRGGIGRLWDRTDLPPMLAAYVAEVRALNGDGRLQAYPGSPWFSQRALREQDRMRLFELHSTDFRTLDSYFGQQGKQCKVFADDGFANLKALLPPPSRRGLTLIDPSYELREDYSRLIQALKDSLLRFPTGMYAIWYPMLAKPESKQLPRQLKALGASNWLHATLSVRGPSPEGFGMNGSGMFIINPPWTLAATLQAELPWLTAALAEDEGACHTLEHEST
ncbi:23S rRNA (adenine(2030)-N(6))-methyltransferase RlmJ [Uliginosibacterium sp. TH139]|uniref:23S rRNA (adenine(2030)-N(6))-methyltransferase RlmJ n=1 Tax=Uliginosibacterium sp. TH139 TaxID=2067453 RepID=UPI000C7E7A8E|nr:23S rRNA (adenine(2030)-N(6))-methyltransferase RlmJ [Uliginosibacterium sp. TH139]PLK49928.1 23S rRNA (adenine(2030)-N(6))-methyltransferase RlmJ [Uliginosibacterium sp. TH139]